MFSLFCWIIISISKGIFQTGDTHIYSYTYTVDFQSSVTSFFWNSKLKCKQKIKEKKKKEKEKLFPLGSCVSQDRLVYAAVIKSLWDSHGHKKSSFFPELCVHPTLARDSAPHSPQGPRVTKVTACVAALPGMRGCLNQWKKGKKVKKKIKAHGYFLPQPEDDTAFLLLRHCSEVVTWPP